MPEMSPEPQLTLHWKKQPVTKARGLAVWLLVVFLGLAACFYLFQVVYPQAQRFTPVPQHVVALNSADPAVREVLNRMHDVDFLILPPASEAVGSMNLDDHSPVFHSTFEGHKLQLQDLPHKTVPLPPARLLQMDAPVLPPLDLSELRSLPTTVSPVVNTARLTMRLTGPLALRAMAAPPDLSGVAMGDPSSCRFQLGVNSDGVVTLALPLATTESPETMQKLGSAMRNIRFAPASARDSAPVWGTAVFEWSNAAR
jgi:hypothetical protein